MHSPKCLHTPFSPYRSLSNGMTGLITLHLFFFFGTSHCPLIFEESLIKALKQEGGGTRTCLLHSLMCTEELFQDDCKALESPHQRCFCNSIFIKLKIKIWK